MHRGHSAFTRARSAARTRTRTRLRAHVHALHACALRAGSQHEQPDLRVIRAHRATLPLPTSNAQTGNKSVTGDRGPSILYRCIVVLHFYDRAFVYEC